MNINNQRSREKIIISILNDIIERNIDIIEGVRLLIKSLAEINYASDKNLENLRGFESETDIFPNDEQKKLYNMEYIKQLEKEKNKYVSANSEIVILSCEEILKKIKRQM